MGYMHCTASILGYLQLQMAILQLVLELHGRRLEGHMQAAYGNIVGEGVFDRSMIAIMEVYDDTFTIFHGKNGDAGVLLECGK